MKMHQTMALIVILLLAGKVDPARGSIRISANSPTEGQALVVTVDGLLPDNCAEVGNFIQTQDGFELKATLDIYDEKNKCLLVMVPYRHEFVFEGLTAGSYHLTFTQRTCFLSVEPMREETVEKTFTVAEPVAVESRTWGSLKAMYHGRK